MNRNPLVIMAVLFCMTVPIITLSASAEQPTVYTVAVPTQLSPLEMHRNWKPFLEKLSQETGVALQLKVYQTILQYDDDILKGIPDLALMNPYLVVMTKKTEGYIPLVRDKNPLIGILLVHKDSPVRSVSELNGKEIAFPTPNAFAASLYMRALLERKEKIAFTSRYVLSHSNVYRNVVLGKTAAGGGVNKSLGKEPEEVKSQLRVLYQTPGSAPHPLSAHPRVPKKVQSALTDAVLRLAGDKASGELLKGVQMPDPVKADYNRDYRPLEDLGLETYVVLGEE